MKLSSCSGSESHGVEERVGGRSLGLPLDPLLNPCQPRRGLMDVIAVGYIDECFEQLLKAFALPNDRGRKRLGGTAARCIHHGLKFLGLAHPMTSSAEAPAPGSGASEIAPRRATFISGSATP
jgi:hypothetical protein